MGDGAPDLIVTIAMTHHASIYLTLKQDRRQTHAFAAAQGAKYLKNNPDGGLTPGEMAQIVFARGRIVAAQGANFQRITQIYTLKRDIDVSL